MEFELECNTFGYFLPYLLSQVVIDQPPFPSFRDMSNGLEMITPPLLIIGLGIGMASCLKRGCKLLHNQEIFR